MYRMKPMKATAFAAAAAAAILTGCATDRAALTEEKMVTSMEFIEGGYAPDCPADVKERRSGIRYGIPQHVTYHSDTCGMERGLSVLLPPSYDGTKEYPVIYFQHGIFGDEYCMVNDANNRFAEITANMAADGDAPEVILVFGNMYATENPNQKPGFKEEDIAPYDNFINELVSDIMPFIGANYSVKKGRENTAVCGFSMGGRESLYIGIKRPDLFGYTGAIAPAPGLVPARDWAMVHRGMTDGNSLKFGSGQEEPYLLMLCCGTNDSVVGSFPRSYHDILTQNGTRHTWFEVIGADHDATAIRSGFYWFMKNVFRSTDSGEKLPQ